MRLQGARQRAPALGREDPRKGHEQAPAQRQAEPRGEEEERRRSGRERSGGQTLEPLLRLEIVATLRVDRGHAHRASQGHHGKREDRGAGGIVVVEVTGPSAHVPRQHPAPHGRVGARVDVGPEVGIQLESLLHQELLGEEQRVLRVPHAGDRAGVERDEGHAEDRERDGDVSSGRPLARTCPAGGETLHRPPSDARLRARSPRKTQNSPAAKFAPMPAAMPTRFAMR